MDSQVNEIRKKLLKNSMLIFIGRGVSIVASFIIIPLIIAKLGMGTYGCWVTILAAGQMLIMVNQALVSTILWQVSGAEEPDSDQQVHNVVRSCCGLILLQTAAVLCVAMLFGEKISEFLDISNFGGVKLAIILSWGGLFLNSITDANAAYLEGIHHSGIVSDLRTGGALIGNLSILLLTLFDCGLPGIALGYGIGYFFYWVAILVLLRSKSAHIFFWPKIPKLEELRRIGTFLSCSTAGRLAAVVRNQLTTIIITKYVSVEMTGYYGIALKLNSLMLEINNFFTVPLIAGIGRLKKDLAAIRLLYGDVLILLAILCGCLATVLCCACNELLFVWMGSTMSVVPLMAFILFAEYGIAIILTNAGAAFCIGSGRIYYETGYLMLNLVLNLLLLPMGIHLGIWGIMGAAALSWIAAGAIFAIYLKSKFGLAGALSASIKALLASIFAVAIVRGVTMLPPLTPLITDVSEMVFRWSGARGLAIFAGMLKGGCGALIFLFLLVYVLRIISADKRNAVFRKILNRG